MYSTKTKSSPKATSGISGEILTFLSNDKEFLDDEDVPDRWKKKQFMTSTELSVCHKQKMTGQGYFGYNAEAFLSPVRGKDTYNDKREVSKRLLGRQLATYNTKFRGDPRAASGIAGDQIPTSKYITIGDNYVDVKEAVPARWKEKQFSANKAPSLCDQQKMAGQGYFGYNEYAFKAPEKGEDKFEDRDVLPDHWKDKQFVAHRAPAICEKQRTTGQGYFGYNDYAFKVPDEHNEFEDKEELPGRWKEKQFTTSKNPAICERQKTTGQGYFGYNDFAFKAPEKGEDPFEDAAGSGKKVVVKGEALDEAKFRAWTEKKDAIAQVKRSKRRQELRELRERERRAAEIRDTLSTKRIGTDDALPAEKSAIERCRRLAKSGYPKYQWQLGCLLENGLGVNVDEPQALKWYEKAAAKGLKQAQRSWDELSYALEKRSGTAAVSRAGMDLEFLSERLRNDKDVVISAVRGRKEGSGSALQFASERLRGTKEVVLAAAANDGYALEFASAELRDDDDCCLAACGQNGFAMRFVSERLRHDKDWGKLAMAANGFSLKYAGENLQDDHEVAVLACEQRGISLQYGKWNPRRDPNCVKASIEESRGLAFEFAAKGSRRNPELLYMAVQDRADEKMLRAAEDYRESLRASRRLHRLSARRGAAALEAETQEGPPAAIEDADAAAGGEKVALLQIQNEGRGEGGGQ